MEPLTSNVTASGLPFPPPKERLLILEDNSDDCFLLERALARTGWAGAYQMVRDGVEAVEYLMGTGKFADRDRFPYPTAIFVDLKMPRMNGLQFLQWIQNHSEHRVIPTIVLTASDQARDVQIAYASGAMSYMVKPSTYKELELLVDMIRRYWATCRRPNSDTPTRIADINA